MFKGYIPMQGKRPLEKIKGRTEFYKLKDVEGLNGYGGVLEDDIILIDIDNMEKAEKVFKIITDLDLSCNIIKTSRGMHFYFKNTNITVNRVNKATAIGINVDIKVGSKTGVIPLKIDGTPREWLKEVKELSYIPKWLTLTRRPYDFSKMEEGEGRNQALFNYILNLQGTGFTIDEIRETIRIINKYIFAEPLEEDEIETILRDDAFLKPSFFDGKTLLHDKFAEFLRDTEHIIKINDSLYIYTGDVYKYTSVDIEKAMIKHIKGVKKATRSEVLTYLNLICENRKITVDNKILCLNGILNLDNMELEEFSPNYVCCNKINANWNINSYSEVMDKTLNKIACNNDDLRALIEEMIGYCLLRRNELGKAFILTGEGSNGKSTLLDVIKVLLGLENISSIGLEEINQRFKTASMYGKLANIGDDISNVYIQDNSTFKKLVTGDTVNVERKGKDPFDFNNYAKLIFSANEIPRINDSSSGLMRRLIIVPFNASFSKKDKDYDPFIKDKLEATESLEYLFQIAVTGLKRVLVNRGFTEVKEVQEEIKEYEKVNNPVVAYLDEEPKIANEASKDVYLRYTVWCAENNLKALSHIQFTKELKKRGYEVKTVKVNRKPTKVFILE